MLLDDAGYCKGLFLLFQPHCTQVATEEKEDWEIPKQTHYLMLPDGQQYRQFCDYNGLGFGG